MVIGLSSIFFLKEFALFWRLKIFHEKQGQPLPVGALYLSGVLEVSLVSALLGGICFLEKDVVFLNAPPFYLYFILIVLSGLHLNFRISLLAGMAAGLEYIGVSLWALSKMVQDPYASLYTLPAVHVEKGTFLVLTGLITALVAREIRNKIRSAYHAEEEHNQIKMVFGQQVSPQVMDELIGGGSEAAASKRVEVSILFMDIRDFTPFAESRPPEEVIRFQNGIFAPIIEIVHQHQGIINQIMGDGLMATFRAPVPSDRHGLEAVQAGISMVEKVKWLSEEGHIPPTRIGIGLHTGEVVVGNIGNSIRQQYSITGTTVITAARLEQLNKQFDTQMIISKESYLQQVRQELPEAFQALGEVSLKGLNRPVEIFALKE